MPRVGHIWIHYEKNMTKQNICAIEPLLWTLFYWLLFRFQCGNVTYHHHFDKKIQFLWTLCYPTGGLAPRSWQNLDQWTTDHTNHTIPVWSSPDFDDISNSVTKKLLPKWCFNCLWKIWKQNHLSHGTLTGSRPWDIMSKLCLPIASLHCQAYPWLSHLWRAALPRESSRPRLCQCIYAKLDHIVLVTTKSDNLITDNNRYFNKLGM